MVKVTMKVTFELMTSKSIGHLLAMSSFHVRFEVISWSCWSRPISLPRSRTLGQSVAWLPIGQAFFSLRSLTPWAWRNDLKIRKVHLLVTISLSFRFEASRLRCCLVINQTIFETRSLWPWTLTWWPQNQLASVIYWSCPTFLPRRTVGIIAPKY